MLLRGNRRYRVTRDVDNSWANYDPENVRVALKTVAGLLTPEEGDRAIEKIYRDREDGTRPIDRP